MWNCSFIIVIYHLPIISAKVEMSENHWVYFIKHTCSLFNYVIWIFQLFSLEIPAEVPKLGGHLHDLEDIINDIAVPQGWLKTF